jgi:hypothetical protein
VNAGIVPLKEAPLLPFQIRFEILTVKVSMSVFWVVTPYGLLEGCIFLRDTYMYLQVHAVLQPRTTTSTSQIIHSKFLILIFYSSPWMTKYSSHWTTTSYHSERYINSPHAWHNWLVAWSHWLWNCAHLAKNSITMDFIHQCNFLKLWSATGMPLRGIRYAANFYYKLYLNIDTFTASHLLYATLNY